MPGTASGEFRIFMVKKANIPYYNILLYHVYLPSQSKTEGFSDGDMENWPYRTGFAVFSSSQQQGGPDTLLNINKITGIFYAIMPVAKVISIYYNVR